VQKEQEEEEEEEGKAQLKEKRASKNNMEKSGHA
jgi:hypothetical protein